MQQATVKAEIIGSDCAVVGDTAVFGNAPVFALCRKLLEIGYDPALPLEAFRGAVCCLRVRSIGEGAQLTARETPSGPKFFKFAPFPDAARRSRVAACVDKNLVAAT